MPITRSYGNAFEVVDYTQELMLVPNTWTLLNEAGLFQEEFLSTHTATFEEVNQTVALVGDTVRGSKPIANTDDIRKIRTYPLAHFAMTDAILPQDIQGKRAYGTQDSAETLNAVMVRKMERIRKNFDITLERARFSTLTTGNIYAPNGTISGNFFSDFGVTQTVINFALTTPGTEVIAKVEEAIATIQDNAFTGDVITGVVCYASPEFFAALIAHANVKDSYRYYSATEGQSILRNRAGAGTGLYREFTFGGVRFIEVRNSLGGQRLIPADEAYFLPLGTDSFTTYFGPANKLDLANSIAERTYMWQYSDPKGERMEIDASSDWINVLRRPKLVVKSTKA